MKRQRIGAVLIVAALVAYSSYSLVGQVLLVRQHRSGTLSISPGESFSFSFDVFPAMSEVRYSFETESGTAASVTIHETGRNLFYVGSSTPLYNSDSLPAGTYEVMISNPNAQSVSAVRYDLTSSGHPAGTVDATLYSSPVLEVMALAAASICLYGFALSPSVAAHRAVYCPRCGFRLKNEKCPSCRVPIMPTNARLGDAR